MSSTNGKAPSADRWDGIERPYTPADVEALRGLRPDRAHARAPRRGAALAAPQDRAVRPRARRDDRWPGRPDGQGGPEVDLPLRLAGRRRREPAGHTYPDQSLYPANSAPALVRRLNNALLRADQIDRAEGSNGTHWLAPIVADAEAGFGGPLNAFELMKAMIEAGAAGVHFEDQLSSEKKCGHLGGKVLVPTAQHVRTLVAARLAADVLDVPTLVVARTDALSAKLLTSDVDETDAEFCTGERTPEGFFRVRDGLEPTIARALAYAPYCDLIWFETSTPDIGEAREFAQAVHERFPGKLFAYNCSPSFNWRRHLDDAEIASFRETLAELGYRYQFVTLAGFHSLNAGMFELARGYAARGCPPTSSSRSASSRSRSTATPPPATSARSAPATSTACSRPSPAARARRSR